MVVVVGEHGEKGWLCCRGGFMYKTTIGAGSSRAFRVGYWMCERTRTSPKCGLCRRSGRTGRVMGYTLT
jgi:hypothetical protein